MGDYNKKSCMRSKKKSRILSYVMTLMLLITNSKIVFAETAKQYNLIRLSGQNRYETSFNIAKEFEGGLVDNIIVTSGNNFPDALTGSVLSKGLKAPILLLNKEVDSSKDSIDYIKDHLKKDGTIYILGGIGVVSNDFVNQFNTLGFKNIIRLGGIDRFDTNKKIIDQLAPSKGTPIIIANGYNFADALSVSSIAAIKGYPIFLSKTKSLPESIKSEISELQPQKVYILGGNGALTEDVVNQVKSLTSLTDIDILRVGGQNRYETSLKICNTFKLDTDTIVIANGEKFPDALSASALAAKSNAPIILTDGKDIIKQKEYIDNSSYTKIILVGGTAAIAKSVEDSFNKVVQDNTTPSGDPVVTPPLDDTNVSSGKVKLDAKTLGIGFSKGDYSNSVTTNIELPLVGQYGSNILWVSSNPGIISNNGKVNQPAGESCIVKLTANLVNNGESASKDFTVNVIKQFENQSLKDNTFEDLAQLNNGVMPDISYNSDEKVDFIDGCYTNLIIQSPRDAIHSLNSVKLIMNIQAPENEYVWQVTNNDGELITYKLQQVYNGIPVKGSEIVIATDITGKALSLSGDYIPNINVVTTPTILEEQAKNLAIQAIGGTTTAISNGLVVEYCNTVEPVLAWEINVEGADATNSYVNISVIINVTSGEIMSSVSLVNDATTYPTTGTDLLGDNRKFNVYGLEGWEAINVFDPNFKLFDTDRNIKTYNVKDYNIFTDLPGRLFTSYFSNTWEDKSSVSAQANVTDTYDYYKNILNRNSFDGNGMLIKTSVHKNMDNAYWNGKQLVFGDGITDFKELVGGLDVVAHEFTHGVVQHTAALKYQNASGAINESYADILGNLIENKADSEWLLGEDVTKDPTKVRALRSMSDPEEFGQPSSIGGTNYVEPGTDEDNGGVHTNSGVVNHAAYLMWQKGILDKEKLAKLWYKSLCKLTSTSDYSDCRNAVISAARNMRMNDDEIRIIQSSFDDVNIKGTLVKTVSGTIYKSDTDRVQANDASIEGATVTVSKEGSTAIVSTVNSDSNGQYKISKLLQGNYIFTFEKANCITYSTLVTISNLNVVLDVRLDSLNANNLKGKITIADSDTNIANNPPLATANISIRKVNGSQTMVKTTTTDSVGSYTVSGLPSGLFEVTINKEGYIPITQTITIRDNQTNYYNAIIEAIPNELGGNGTASGVIIDVLTGSGVSGLTLNIRNGLNNNSEGTIVDTIKTKVDGTYSTSQLTAGNYCIEIIDTRSIVEGVPSYLPSFTNIKILGGKDISNQNGTVTTSMYSDQLRFVLNWGSSPSDLDSHLFGPTSNGGTFHTWFSNKSYLENSTEIANLDLDDTSSWGPETTTIYKTLSGKYRFYIHDYTNRYSPSSISLGNSGASVQIFMGNSPVPIYVFNVPQSVGSVWAVFEYDSVTQEISPINKVYYQDNPNNIIP